MCWIHCYPLYYVYVTSAKSFLRKYPNLPAELERSTGRGVSSNFSQLLIKFHNFTGKRKKTSLIFKSCLAPVESYSYN